jgi:hypothetical protein
MVSSVILRTSRASCCEAAAVQQARGTAASSLGRGFPKQDYGLDLPSTYDPYDRVPNSSGTARAFSNGPGPDNLLSRSQYM